MKKIVIASNNPGKLREIGAIMAPLDFEVFPQSAFNIPEAEEPYCTTRSSGWRRQSSIAGCVERS